LKFPPINSSTDQPVFSPEALMSDNNKTSHESTSVKPSLDEKKIAGSMNTEEPDGWDLAPQNIADPRQQRHPRPDSTGGIEPADEQATPLERQIQRDVKRIAERAP
jgi:hypothetical protein